MALLPAKSRSTTVTILLLSAVVSIMLLSASLPYRSYEGFSRIVGNSSSAVSTLPSISPSLAPNVSTTTDVEYAQSSAPPVDLQEDIDQEDIDLWQARFLDFVNGEEGILNNRTHFGVFGGSLLNLTAGFDVHLAWSRVHDYGMQVHSLDYDRSDIHELARRVRANLIAYTLLYDKPALMALVAKSYYSGDDSTHRMRTDLERIVNGTTAKLYGWLSPAHESIRDLHLHFLSPKTADIGLVFTTGTWHFDLAAHAIIVLREVLKCTLPIEVQYMGPDDLPANMRDALDSLPGVTTVDILKTFSVSDQMHGWAIKPFAILASNFKQVVFVDADALFFQSPEVVLEKSALYREFGQLFYYDRTISTDNPPTWFLNIDPENSQYSKTLRYLTGKSMYEMEAGVVALDKRRTGVLHALLMTCKLNTGLEKEVVYKNVHGDKETFWMSWDMARVPYRFTPAFGGAVGFKNNDGAVCGGLYHPDEYGMPFWWNSGVLVNKRHSMTTGFVDFQYAAVDMYAEGMNWKWETNVTPFCLKPRNPDEEIQELSKADKNVAAKYVEIYKQLKKDGWKEYFTRHYGTKFRPNVFANATSTA